MIKKVVYTTLMTSAVLFAESGVSVNINDTDLELEAVLDSRNLKALQTTSTIYQVDFNFLNNDEDTQMVGLGLGATNKLEGIPGIELTFGAKAVWAEVGTENFTALPFMAKVRYAFPPLMYNIPPVALEGKVLYAPKPLSFGDSDGYNEYRVSADIEMIENVRIYVGYRNIHTHYKTMDNSLFNTSFYGGFKMTY